MNSSLCDLELQASLSAPQTRSEAAAKIYARYTPDMRRIARKRIRKQFSARLCSEDVLQSTWRSFHGCVSTLKITDSFWPYLYTILIRKIARVVEIHTAAKRDIAREASLGATSDRTLSCKKNDDLYWVRESMNKLDPLHRQVIEMRLEGHTQSEIAKLLGKSVKFVQRYQQSAIEILRSELADQAI